MRLSLLVLSQLLSLLAGLGFPIFFARWFGTESFGDLALAVSYAGVALAISAGAVGQSIIKHGISSRLFDRAGAIMFTMSFVLWLITLRAQVKDWQSIAIIVPHVLAAQILVHLSFYYALRRGLKLVYTSLFAVETLLRIGLSWLCYAFSFELLAALSGVYVLSAGLVFLWVVIAARLAKDPVSESSPVNWATSRRFVAWALSGIVLSNFDRTLFASALDADTRASFLFYNSLYVSAFGIIANSVSLDVVTLRGQASALGRARFFAILGLGIGGAAVGTVLLFRLAPLSAELTHFDPRIAAYAILLGCAYRTILFVHQLAYGYLERAGHALRSIKLRIGASLLMIVVGASYSVLPPAAYFVAVLIPLLVVAANAINDARRSDFGGRVSEPALL